VQLDQGTYGHCSSCGEPIGARRLQVLPYSDLCISCAEAAG
jgi:RNA polymerase-binding transcription factor DksA